jgi:hypothetical protein
LSQPSTFGTARIAGLDLTVPRTRAVIAAVVTWAPLPHGFSASDLAHNVNRVRGSHAPGYTQRFRR